jgi:hypothetical protein
VLIKASTLKNYKLYSLDGEIGKVIERINWSESKVFVNLSSEVIKESPEYTDETPLTREYETELHGHYNRKGYWVDEPAAKEHLL